MEPGAHASQVPSVPRPPLERSRYGEQSRGVQGGVVPSMLSCQGHPPLPLAAVG